MVLDDTDNNHDHDAIEFLHAIPLISIVAIYHYWQSWLAHVPIDDSHSFTAIATFGYNGTAFRIPQIFLKPVRSKD